MSSPTKMPNRLHSIVFIKTVKHGQNCDYLLAMATNNPFLGDVMYGAGGGAVQQGGGDQGQYYGRGYTQV